MLRFANDTFQTSFITTVGVDYKHKHVTVDGQRIRLAVCGGQARKTPLRSARAACGEANALAASMTIGFCPDPPQVWDTAGQERFRAITRSYLRGAQVRGGAGARG